MPSCFLGKEFYLGDSIKQTTVNEEQVVWKSSTLVHIWGIPHICKQANQLTKKPTN